MLLQTRRGQATLSFIATILFVKAQLHWHVSWANYRLACTTDGRRRQYNGIL